MKVLINTGLSVDKIHYEIQPIYDLELPHKIVDYSCQVQLKVQDGSGAICFNLTEWEELDGLIGEFQTIRHEWHESLDKLWESNHGI